MVAKQYKTDPELYRKTARHWAQIYAGGKFIIAILSLLGLHIEFMSLHVHMFKREKLNISLLYMYVEL